MDKKEAQSTEPIRAPHKTALILLAAATIALGLASRRYDIFPDLLKNYPGDALWATLVFIVWAFLLPHLSIKKIAALTLATSLAIELSQLYKAPWINQLRDTLFGKLVLGSGFDPIDLVAYLAGALLGMATVSLLPRIDSSKCSLNT
ncbi:hypothetical protein VDG1235_4532 [Verrucomicrobiia bacterium DG1235]|nr:hypothetical protein VDG1235_4532 [Verrucomicrobiae bacterium DG1235]